MKLTYISPRSLTESEIELLAMTSLRTYDGTQAKDFVQKALKGLLRFYRISGEMQGLVGLEILKVPTGDQLWVSFVAGKGAVKFIKEIWQELKQIQKEAGCSSIATMAKGEGLRIIYSKKLNLKPLAFLFQEGT